MVANAVKVWVKGDPENKILGDCPFCHRTLLTLELKGMEYEKDYIDFSNKPDWLFDVIPSGTVPVMKDGEKWIPDSGDICNYLEDNYKPSMGSGQIEGVGEKLLPSFVQFLKASSEEAAEKEAALLEQLEQIDSYLAKNGPFLNGNTMGAADALVVPRLYHLSVALPHFRNWSIPEKFTNVLDYLKAAKETDAFKNTDYGHDMIIKGWKAHGV